MYNILLCALLLAPALAEPQYVKNGVKGGYGGAYVYNPGAKLPNFYGNSSTNQYGGSSYGTHNTSQSGYNQGGYNQGGYNQGGYNQGGYNQGGYNQTAINYEVGVCYIEVPTATLAKNPAHVPAGNGSRPDLSRVRSCCKGYIRNIHNFLICDPVCAEECVNGLCTAPDTCSCFPDHVKNLAGFCIPTCPIGCQNGYCSGGECLCKDGFKLDINGKFCTPSCRENCGGYGNCTLPNVCSCKEGYQSTTEGGCKPAGYQGSPGQNPNIISPPYNPSHHQNPLGPGSQIVTPNPMQHTYPSSPIYPGQYNPSNPGQPGYRNPGQDSNNPGQRYPGYPYPDQSNSNSLYPKLPSAPYNTTYPTNNSTYPQGTNSSYNPYPNRPYYPGGQNPSQPGEHGSNYPYYPQPGSSNNYPGQSNYPSYPSQPGQANGTSSPGQPWSNNPAYPGSQGSSYDRGQQSYSGQQEHNQSGYHKQSGYQGQSEYQGQYDYDRSDYQGQASQGQHGYHSQSGYHEQSGYNNIQSGYQHQSQNHSLSSSSLHKKAGRGDVEPYYPGSQMYGETQQSAKLDDIYQCSEECVNGVCVNGNRCQCNPGYVQDSSDPTERKCVPFCAGGCTNGVCSAPNFCICNVGYYKDRSVKGRSASCVKRIRRSIDTKSSLADLLIFEIPDDE